MITTTSIPRAQTRSNDHPHTHRDEALRSYLGLLLLTVLIYALMYAPQPMFNALRTEFDTDMSTTGLLLSVYMLSLAIAPLCIGVLVERVGTRRIIAVSCAVLGLSGIGIHFAPTFGVLLAVRAFQALFAPALLTAVMTSISGLFRHLDLNRAMAGYVTCTLVGSMTGRILGGWCAEFFGWRMSLTGACALLLLGVLLARTLDDHSRTARLHHLREYMTVFRQAGVKSLFFVEACGIFVFAAIGNLLPFRMAELGQGSSEGMIGLMYLGYSIGLVAGVSIGPMQKLCGSENRLLLLGSAVFVLSVATLAVPSLWMLFGGLWAIAFGEFVVHALAPGVINHLATRGGECDRGMVNGLFLSCYYIGGVLGSIVPGIVYAHCGWTACYLCMQGVQVVSFLVLFRLCRTMPVLR